PLIAFYQSRGLLRVIDAKGELDAVTRRLAAALAAPAAPRPRQSAARSTARGKPARAAKSRARGARATTRRVKAARKKTPARPARKAARRGATPKRRAARRRTRR
ncbi:MAG TPA: hypothetical protein VEC59_12380, partial [Steroidobacteraceae bacterium]|nr:hypothetical protein [Steroidobacteraceae bacterium]